MGRDQNQWKGRRQPFKPNSHNHTAQNATNKGRAGGPPPPAQSAHFKLKKELRVKEDELKKCVNSTRGVGLSADDQLSVSFALKASIEVRGQIEAHLKQLADTAAAAADAAAAALQKAKEATDARCLQLISITT